MLNKYAKYMQKIHACGKALNRQKVALEVNILYVVFPYY